MRSISRRDLYALGEALGESVTRRKLGGGVMCGGGGGGSSSSSTATTSVDKRLAVGDGGLCVTGDANVITVTDAGAIAEAFKFATGANATNAEGFTKLLDVGERLIGTTQKHVADAYAVAQTTKNGAIDQKTMIVLAVVAGGAYALSRGKR